ncbi:hypothetical protein ACWDR6_35715, partial [Streptomyces ardesiacus]
MDGLDDGGIGHMRVKDDQTAVGGGRSGLRRRRTVTALAGLALTAGLLAGCSSSDGDDGAGGGAGGGGARGRTDAGTGGG